MSIFLLFQRFLWLKYWRGLRLLLQPRRNQRAATSCRSLISKDQGTSSFPCKTCASITHIFHLRPKSVPNSPSIPRAFSNLRHQLTSAWSSHSAKKKQQSSGSGNSGQSSSNLSQDDKKKWSSSQDCGSKSTLYLVTSLYVIGFSFYFG